MSQFSEDLDADRFQAALTRRFLQPALAGLERTLLDVRAETDRALQSTAAARYGHPYPYGYCAEITLDVMRRLRTRLSRPRSAGERALKTFLSQGGEGRMVWGVLRDRYFQNAIQFGSLYVDVSNDTVDINKPKVEILPMREAGLEPVRDTAHFVRIGEAYWGGRLYANTALPSLAPVFPMILVDHRGGVQLQARNSRMIDLFAADGFRRAELWLAEGPGPPLEAVAALRAACSNGLLAENAVPGVGASLEACRRMRAAALVLDEAWMLRMFALYDRAPSARLGDVSGAVADIKRSNTRLHAGAFGITA